MNKRLNFFVDSIAKDIEILVGVGGALSFIGSPIIAYFLKIDVAINTLVIGTALFYLASVIIYYAWKAKDVS